MASRDTKLNIIVDAQNRTQGTFNNLKNNLDSVKRSHEGLISAMRGVGTAGAVAFGGLALITKGIIQAGAGFEQTQIAFETMIGNAELAKKTLQELSQFAAKTPFELTQLEEASKRLLAYGVEVEDLIPTLRMLGDISSGVGMDKLPQLILAFGQVRAATKLTGMELRQFSEAGVPLLGTLAEQLGKTEAEIIEMVSAGEIGFPLVQDALASLTGEGGKFFNLMERQSSSLGGLWSNFKDQLALTARSIGQELLPVVKPFVEQLIAITQRVGEFVKAHPQLSAGLLAAALGFTALLAVLLPISLVLPGLLLTFSALGTAFAFVASGPGIAIIATLGALGLAITQVSRIVMLLKNDWDTVWLGIKIIASEAANSVIGIVEGMINFVIAGVNKAIDAINKVIRAANKVPGVDISNIGKIDNVDFGQIDTDLVASAHLNKPTERPANNVVNILGGTYLSDDVATDIGDRIMNRLKMNAAL